MLSEASIAGVYFPPFFIYMCVAGLVFWLLRYLFYRMGWLQRIWHTALFEFVLSLIVLSLLFFYF